MLESSTTLNGRFLCGRLSIWNSIEIIIHGQIFDIIIFNKYGQIFDMN